MPYKVSIKKSAFKVLKKLKEPYYSKIKSAIYKLADDPYPHGHIKLKGRGGYRIRVADYRVIYEVFEEELLVDVVNVGHRKDVYR